MTTLKKRNNLTGKRRPQQNGPDRAAIQAATTSLEQTKAEAIILFGSRARNDWTPKSDIDIMVISKADATIQQIKETELTIKRIVKENYPNDETPRQPAIDFSHLEKQDFLRRALHTINDVAHHAWIEGIIMPRNPNEYSGEHRMDDQDEIEIRDKRIEDVAMHYRIMQNELDKEEYSRGMVYHEHQVLENGMKALISQLGDEYAHTHRLDLLLDHIRDLDPEWDWEPVSDIDNLSAHAGGPRYNAAIYPIEDCHEMSNQITEDMIEIFARIEQLSGYDPMTWKDPVRGTGIEPRTRDIGYGPWNIRWETEMKDFKNDEWYFKPRIELETHRLEDDPHASLRDRNANQAATPS